MAAGLAVALCWVPLSYGNCLAGQCCPTTSVLCIVPQEGLSCPPVKILASYLWGKWLIPGLTCGAWTMSVYVQIV